MGEFRVGITGHRHLADPDAVRAPLSAALDAAEHAAAGGQVALVTCLAEGADRLAAHLVAGRDGWVIEVVLPLPADEYGLDFPDSQAEFAELLALAASVTVHEGIARPEAYRAAGYDVVHRCDMLIAVWDGRPAAGPGGTADIVSAARARAIPVLVLPASRAMVP